MNSFRLVNAKCNYPLLCINSAWCCLQVRRHIRPHFQHSDSMRVLYEVITFVGKTLAFGYMAFPFTMLDFWPPIKIYRYRLLFSFAFCFHWIIHCAPIYVFRGWYCTIIVCLIWYRINANAWCVLFLQWDVLLVAHSGFGYHRPLSFYSSNIFQVERAG